MFIFSHFKAQLENPDTRWSLREDFAVVYTDVQGELTIGGVFQITDLPWTPNKNQVLQ
jgi:hypothetical protein